MEQIINISGVLLISDLSVDTQQRLQVHKLEVEKPYVKIQRGILIREKLVERTKTIKIKTIKAPSPEEEFIEAEAAHVTTIEPSSAKINVTIENNDVEEQIEDDYNDDDEANDETLLLIVRTPNDHNCFYLCTTQQSEDETMIIMKRLESRVRSQITRYVRHKWEPNPSTVNDIDAEKPVLKRGLINVECCMKYPRYKCITLNLNLAQECSKNGCYTELVTTEKYRKDIVRQKCVSVYVQARPFTTETGTQTVLKYPKNTWTQYEFSYPEIAELSEEFATYFNDTLLKEIHILEKAFLHNSYLNFYSLDYYSGVLPYKPRGPIDYEVRSVLKDVIRCKDKVISAFIQMNYGYVAATYSDHSWRATRRQKNIKKSALDLNFVLIWNENDSLLPKILLDTLGHEIMALEYKENYILGGCTNGQVILWFCDLSSNDHYHQVTDNEYYRFVSFLFNWPIDIVNLQILRPLGISPVTHSHIDSIAAMSWLDQQIFGQFPENTIQFFTIGLDGCIKFWNCPLDKLKSSKSKWKASKWDLIRKRIIASTEDPAENSTIFQLKPYFERKLLNFPVSAVYLLVQDYKILIVGTFLGHLLVFKWDADENEFKEFAECSGHHDGPLMTIEKHPRFNEVFLCVGGRIFSIWHINFDCLEEPNKVMLRKCSSANVTHVKYTDGRWINNNGGVCLSRTDGCIEFWDIRVQSNVFLEALYITSEEIVQIHLDFTLENRENSILLSDTSGTLFRINILNYHSNNTPDDIETCREIFLNSALAYSNWYKWMQENHKRAESAKMKLLEEAKLEQLKNLRRSRARAMRSKSIQRDKTPKRKEKLDFNQLETQYAIDTVLNQKNMILEQEVQLQVPVKQAEAEEKRLKYKRKEILRKCDEIFNVNTSMHFPQFVESETDLEVTFASSRRLRHVEDKQYKVRLEELPSVIPSQQRNEQIMMKTQKLQLAREQQQDESINTYSSLRIEHKVNKEYKDALEKQYVDAYWLMKSELECLLEKNRFILQEHQRFHLRSALRRKRREVWNTCARKQRR